MSAKMKPWDETNWACDGAQVRTWDGSDIPNVASFGTRERAKLACAAPKMMRALLLVEWAHGQCPLCSGPAATGHFKDCQLHAAIEAAWS